MEILPWMNIFAKETVVGISLLLEPYYARIVKIIMTVTRFKYEQFIKVKGKSENIIVKCKTSIKVYNIY